MKYNMLQHARETPEALRRTLESALEPVRELSTQCKRRRWEMVILTGCGASYHDAVAARPAFETLLGLPRWPAPPRNWVLC